MTSIWNAAIYHPLLNTLIFLYKTIALEDLGLAIIFLTILIRLILFPIFSKSAKHQVVMQSLQPRLKKIQDEHKKDKAKQAQATMDLYKSNNINPFSGFFLILIQLPILFALYSIINNVLKGSQALTGIYSFIALPTSINTSFLGLINLSAHSIVGVNLVILILAAAAQYYQGKLSLPKQEAGVELSSVEKMGRRMVFFGPILTVVIFANLPAAISLYWLVSSVFSVGQQIIVNRQLANGKLGNVRQENN